MRSHGQFCPVAQALEVVGERWSLLIIRELMCGNYRFSEIMNGVPLMPRSLLSQRLRTLEEAGLIMRAPREGGAVSEYRLTQAGRELEPIVMGLGTWGQRWVKRKLRVEELDPVLLMWDVRRRLDPAALPSEPTVVMFWFRDLAAKRSRYWLRIAGSEVDLCLTNPGYDVDLSIETTLRTMVEVWRGELEVKQALHTGKLELKGKPRLCRRFPSWLLLSVFADVEPSTAASA